ncbi:hypothetical protein EK21DRAFT_94041 [Setomelanomma holmii]|uniref:Uncharacterized protein n=1 Tax=Setomelanomma holmii TaxID=210430 RepID=A0A9P4GZG3_9PLEO|nr:hypothetical protein EK21DRAFT_94041 [Setomelanomma holmii]
MRRLRAYGGVACCRPVAFGCWSSFTFTQLMTRRTAPCYHDELPNLFRDHKLLMCWSGFLRQQMTPTVMTAFRFLDLPAGNRAKHQSLDQATVAVHPNDLSTFLNTFYEPEIVRDHGPRQLDVHLPDTYDETDPINIIPLLRIHKSVSGFVCRFYIKYEDVDERGGSCFEKGYYHKANALFKCGDQRWLELLGSESISKLDVSYAVTDGDMDLGVELAEGYMLGT